MSKFPRPRTADEATRRLALLIAGVASAQFALSALELTMPRTWMSGIWWVAALGVFVVVYQNEKYLRARRRRGLP